MDSDEDTAVGPTPGGTELDDHREKFQEREKRHEGTEEVGRERPHNQEQPQANKDGKKREEGHKNEQEEASSAGEHPPGELLPMPGSFDFENEQHEQYPHVHHIGHLLGDWLSRLKIT